MRYLLKLGELMLKKGNRRRFERALKSSIHKRLPGWDVYMRDGRFYISAPKAQQSKDCGSCEDCESCEEKLAALPGITGFAPVYSCDKSDAAIEALVCKLADAHVESPARPATFRLHVRRTDKSLSKDSQAYAVWLGNVITARHPSLRVRLKNPDWSISLELREQAYIYDRELKGLGGLPSGTCGRGMVMLSGGIDSPVAAYLMACRGMHLEAVYFDTPPFTPEEAFGKVQRLAARLARWTHSGGNGRSYPNASEEQGVAEREARILLHRVPFSALQLALRKHVRPAALTLQSRACMIMIAERLAAVKRSGRACAALISGEALSQVASQTIENLSYTNSFATMPILRPLISFDKEQIIAQSRQIGCLEISMEPYVDCCTYFSPEHPITQANLAEQADLKNELYAVPQLQELLEEAFNGVQTLALAPDWEFGG